jgi:hypothetical protein
MASPPVGPRPNRRAALNVTKTTKPKAATRGALVSSAADKPAVKKTTDAKKVTRARRVLTDDEARQQVAQRIVRKIFAEAGVPPERVMIGTEPSSAVRSRPVPTIAVATSAPGKTSNSTTTDKTTSPEPEMVVMPSNASERLLSKASALQVWYREQFPRKVGLVCTVAGLIFSAVGGFSLVPFVGAMYPDWESFQSALVCGALNCEQTTTTTGSQTSTQTSTQTSSQTSSQTSTGGSGQTTTNTTNTTNTGTNTTSTSAPVPSPAISFLTKPPAVLTGPATFVVRAEYVAELVVLAESRTTGQRYPLRREGEPAGPDHTFSLQPGQFPAGEYDLRARAIAQRDAKVVYATGPRFRVETSTTPPPIPAGSPPSTSTAIIPSSTTPPPTPENQPEPMANTTEVPEPARGEIAAPTTTTAAIPTQTTITLSYVRPAPGFIAVTVLASDAQAVEVYAQRLSATAPTLVGLARRVEPNRWLLSYDTRSLPNGSYVLVGRVKTTRGDLDTPRVPLFVENQTPVSSTATTTTTRAAAETVEAVERLEASETPLPDRRAYTEALPPATEVNESKPAVVPAPPPAMREAAERTVVAPLPVTSVPEPLRPVVREQFSENADALNDLFKRYASAVQTNDESLRTMVEDELRKKRTRLVEETIASGERSVTASDLDQSLATEFDRLKRQVETFENLLRERSGQNSAVDQDRDGVSDHDEATLYDTDPTQFDTDGDGVSDGAEIMRGFDPLSSAQEAIVTYTSPKEFGLVRDDVLTVAAVTPVIETDRERGTPPVQAEIRGTGIPNSFVTLFIFSSPTVVTVRTADDGSFVYQFDKELEDGTHEVYVAVTDNTGDIIAKSSPFSFVKEAEAFTVVDAATAAPVASSDPAASVSIDQLYQVITAMVVLAFGLILLIFGIVMRREPTPTAGGAGTEATV